jgi:hypothetical protein
MKASILIVRSFILVLITGLIFTSCKKDPGPDKQTPTEDIVGTWTSGTSTLSIMVGTKTLTQYFVEVMELTAEEAQMSSEFFDQAIKEAFTGTIQFKADKTFVSNLGGITESGTWSINSDKSKLTMSSAEEGSVSYDVLELSASKLHLKAIQSSDEDLNQDGTPETIIATIELNFSK